MNTDYIEDIPEVPADPETVLTDEQLTAGGLVKVNAFMRTKASANALRVKKHKDKKEAEGIKQINVLATVEARQVIKAIAERTKEGETLASVLSSISNAQASEGMAKITPEQISILELGYKVQKLTGWKKLVARFIGLEHV